MDKAIEYYEIVSAQPNHKLSAESDYSIANAYVENNINNDEKIIEAFRNSCLKQYPKACHDLGYYYYIGEIGVKSDFVNAKVWFDKAANLNDLKSLHYLGKMYLKG